MNIESDKLQDRLERLATAQLCALPLLRAPASLEARVMAAIAAQAAARSARGFHRWPWWATGLFVLFAALVGYWLSGQSVHMFNGAQAQLAAAGGSAADVSSWFHLLRTLGQTAAVITDAIPANWVLLATGMIFACYAALAAGGVFAYRTISKV